VSTRRAKPSAKPGEPLGEALRALVAGLKASARPSMIIGGIAVIARGVPRLTRDIDATVAGGGTDIEALLGVLARHAIVPRIEDAVGFARQNHVLLLRHAPSGIDVDLSVAWLPFELDAIAASDVIRSASRKSKRCWSRRGRPRAARPSPCRRIPPDACRGRGDRLENVAGRTAPPLTPGR
jgi:hypothetical protein